MRVPALAIRAATIAAFVALYAAPVAIAFAERPAGEPSPAAGASEPNPANAANPAPAGVGRANLTAEECRSLYEHQLSLVASDPENPLHAALGVNSVAMQSAAARAAEARRCLERTTRASFECQMIARSLGDLLQCRSRASEAPTADESGPGESGGVQLENLPGARLAVTPQTCRQAYDRIFNVMTTAPGFSERRDREQLLARWRSPEARASFERRCTEKFQATDLGCILSTEDPDVIQGCLLVIPDET